MKATTILILTLLFSFSAIADTADILRSKANPEHLDITKFKSGLIELLDNKTLIKMSLFLNQAAPNEPKEMIFEFPVTDVNTDNCGVIKYESDQDDFYVVLTDETLSNSEEEGCKEPSILFPVKLVYSTFGENGEATSVFDASSFRKTAAQSGAPSIKSIFKASPVKKILPVIDVM